MGSLQHHQQRTEELLRVKLQRDGRVLCSTNASQAGSRIGGWKLGGLQSASPSTSMKGGEEEAATA